MKVNITKGNTNNDGESICDELLKKDLLELIQAGLSHSSASSYLAKKYSFSKNKVYKLLLED